jgi:hypothetical protein
VTGIDRQEREGPRDGHPGGVEREHPVRDLVLGMDRCPGVLVPVVRVVVADRRGEGVRSGLVDRSAQPPRERLPRAGPPASQAGPVAAAAQRVERAGQVPVIAGGLAEHEPAHDPLPGPVEPAPVQFPARLRVRREPVDLVVQHSHQRRGQMVQRSVRLQHRLVAAPARVPGRPAREQHAVRLEPAQRRVLVRGVGRERLGRVAEQPLHVARREHHGHRASRRAQPQRARPVPFPQSREQPDRRPVGLEPLGQRHRQTAALHRPGRDGRQRRPESELDGLVPARNRYRLVHASLLWAPHRVYPPPPGGNGRPARPRGFRRAGRGTRSPSDLAETGHRGGERP